jgi:hypothetical protein
MRRRKFCSQDRLDPLVLGDPSIQPETIPHASITWQHEFYLRVLIYEHVFACISEKSLDIIQEIVMSTWATQVARRVWILSMLMLIGCGEQDSNLEPINESANASTVESARASWEATAEASPAKMVGSLDPVECQGLHGWAWDPKRPNDPVKVDIYDGDHLVTTLVADKFRKDLAEVGIGDGKHSFEMVLPKELIDGKSHSIRAKFSGKEVDLPLSPQTLFCTEDDASRKAQERIDGSFDTADCQSIRGWAWDPRRPNEPIKVDIYDGNKFVVTLVADKFRQDLVDAGYGDGKHGFAMVPPLKLCDGTARAIHVKFSGRPVDLKCSPRTFLCSEEKTD